ncbi:MAG: deoxyribonuclease IV [Chloroflexi bacterium]|nr:deoxyribonuclease IV [Chloroflexota bacterium]MCH7982901.1 deoxyribonuclease IV [Chloroflexota bacterium]MCH8114036.1 deoxyribonuclease IV [Chloroflexota bacterium]MCH8229105.1 deoxyribonuclease IV [Chloroflexota bacterium]MCH8911355.1 deoxyribonuclease IV [Chloroflexota bacterium]
MLIGAHVSAAGGTFKAVARAEEIGAECFQIFASSPRMWSAKPIPEKVAEKYRSEMERAGMGPTVLHGKYLIALGSPDAELVAKSETALRADMAAANILGALGVIFHPASHRGQGFDAVVDRFAASVRKVLDSEPGDTLLMLETSAGAGDHIGSSFAELGTLVRAIGDDRVAVCLDTQHVWAAGYDISSTDTLNTAIDEFDREIGLDLLRSVHANDSMRGLGSAVDRHDNIGEGFIGAAGFATVMSHEAFKDIPFYLEVPGTNKSGPDRPNVDALKKIRTQVGAG